MYELLAKNISSYNFTDFSVEMLLVFVVTFLMCILIAYRFRKKRKFPPGPIGLPFVGYLPFLGSEPHKTFSKLSKTYGDILSVYLGNKYTIILNEYTLMKETLTHPAALDRAPNIFDQIPNTGFISANGEEWVEQRRFCIFALRDLGLGRGPWENLLVGEITGFIKHLESFQGQPTDISHSLSLSLSSNIISLLIGRHLDKEKEADKIHTALGYAEVALTHNSPSSVVSGIPWLRKYLEFFRIGGHDIVAENVKKFDSFMRQEITRHKTSSKFRDFHDFINTYHKRMAEILPSEKAKHYYADEKLGGNLNILFLGASDTTHSSLIWLFRLMAVHEDIQEKVYNEIIEVLGEAELARYSERQKIPYTSAVIMEAQRYSSIVPLNTTRQANRDFTVRGYTIPKGAEIVANLWAIHNDPKYWKEPEKFKPEHFLTDDGKTLLKNPPSYVPFSIGRRNCPGETIALMEIMLYFTEIIKKFQISPPPGTKPNFRIINGLVTRMEPQPVCFKERRKIS